MQPGVNPDNIVPQPETAVHPAFSPVFRTIESLKLSAALAMEALWPLANETPLEAAHARQTIALCRDFRSELDFLAYSLQNAPHTPFFVSLKHTTDQYLKEIAEKPEDMPAHLLRLLFRNLSLALDKDYSTPSDMGDKYPVPDDAPRMYARGFIRRDEDRLVGFLAKCGSINGLSMENIRRACIRILPTSTVHIFETERQQELRAYIVYSSQPHSEMRVGDMGVCADQFKYHYLDCVASHLDWWIPHHSLGQKYVTLQIPLDRRDLIDFCLCRGYFTAGGMRDGNGDLNRVLLSKLTKEFR